MRFGLSTTTRWDDKKGRTLRSTSPLRFSLAQSSWLNPFSTRTRPLGALTTFVVVVGGWSAAAAGGGPPSTRTSGSAGASSSPSWSPASSESIVDPNAPGGESESESAPSEGAREAGWRARCCEDKAGKATWLVCGSATMDGIESCGVAAAGEGADESPR